MKSGYGGGSFQPLPIPSGFHTDLAAPRLQLSEFPSRHGRRLHVLKLRRLRSAALGGCMNSPSPLKDILQNYNETVLSRASPARNASKIANMLGIHAGLVGKS